MSRVTGFRREDLIQLKLGRLDILRTGGDTPSFCRFIKNKEMLIFEYSFLGNLARVQDNYSIHTFLAVQLKFEQAKSQLDW